MKKATIQPNTDINSLTLQTALAMIAQFLDGRVHQMILEVDGEWKVHGGMPLASHVIFLSSQFFCNL